MTKAIFLLTKKEKPKPIRNRYSPEYKTEALALSEKLGVPTAAKQLGLNESQLYAWRSKARLKQASSAVEDQLRTENVRLKRQLADQKEELEILKKAAAYFAKGLR